MAAVRLSTFDNPYDPFESFYDWYMWDELHGYNSCGYLDRIARTSNQFSDYENSEEIERAIDDIIANDVTGMRCKVVEGKPLPRLETKTDTKTDESPSVPDTTEQTI